ncbi:protein of unknown function [Serratia sp. Tan611]|nr:protein of unknown function [Serratia sp. Tan611]
MPGADVEYPLLQRNGMADQRHHGGNDGKPTVCAILPQQAGNDQSKAEQVGYQSHDGKYWHSVILGIGVVNRTVSIALSAPHSNRSPTLRQRSLTLRVIIAAIVSPWRPVITLSLRRCLKI